MSFEGRFVDFTETFENMQLNCDMDINDYYRLLLTSREFWLDFNNELRKRNSVLNNLLKHLPRTAATTTERFELILPMHFDIFLPIRLGVAVETEFDEQDYSVKLTKHDFSHPFVFGHSLNTKCMNLIIKRELECVAYSLRSWEDGGRVLYDVSYESLMYGTVPFAHSLVLMTVGTGIIIRFDFVACLEFDGPEMPLPPFFSSLIDNKWYAYGAPDVNPETNDSNKWGVLVPKWQCASADSSNRSANICRMLYRMMASQECDCFATPFSVKFSFVLATEQCGYLYQSLSVAETFLLMFGAQVLGNFCHIIVESATDDFDTVKRQTLELRKQQVYGKMLYAIMVQCLRKNLVSEDFVYEYLHFCLNA